MEATTIPHSRRVSSSASFLQFFRAAHKRPTDPAVQVGALDAEPRLVDLGPPPPVRCARCASTRNLELLLPTGRWINLPMEQRLFCERKASRLIRCTPMERRLQPHRRTQRPWPRRRQFGEHGFGKKQVSSCSTAPSCGRSISTMLAQKCKNGAAGCYRAMTAKEGMSHRLLEASQHSRSRNYDRKSDSWSQEQP